jgi:hypothetical protein
MYWVIYLVVYLTTKRDLGLQKKKKSYLIVLHFSDNKRFKVGCRDTAVTGKFESSP